MSILSNNVISGISNTGFTWEASLAITTGPKRVKHLLDVFNLKKIDRSVIKDQVIDLELHTLSIHLYFI